MKEYLVSLDLRTPSSVTIAQISECLGLSREILMRKETQQGLLWKIESNAEKCSSLEEQIEAMLSMIPHKILLGSRSMIQEVYLSIGILHDSATCTITLPNSLLMTIMMKCPDVHIELTCYPCQEDGSSEQL